MLHKLANRHSHAHLLFKGIFAVVFMSILASFSPTLAQTEQSKPNSNNNGYIDQPVVDRLFADLAIAPNAQNAREIADQIWSLWFSPLQQDLLLRMRVLGIAQQSGNRAAVLNVLNSIVQDFPDYAEGWNQRATLFFVQGKLEASLADVEQVLAIEPRHFGALAGQAAIYQRLGKPDLARLSIERAKQIHPFLSQSAQPAQVLPPPTIT